MSLPSVAWFIRTGIGGCVSSFLLLLLLNNMVKGHLTYFTVRFLSVFAFYCVIHTTIKSNFGKEGFIWIIVYPQGKTRQESGSRGWSRNHGGMLRASLSSLLSCRKNPDHLSSGGHAHSGLGFLPSINSQENTVQTHLQASLTMGAFSQLRFPFSR